jgi:hypothetical protein
LPLKPVNAKDPEDYIAQIDEPRKADIEALDKMIRAEGGPNVEPHIQYGMLVYEPVAALASQKRYISLYVTCETEAGHLTDQYRDRLPRARIGKSCIRFNRLSDVDQDVLRDLIREAAEATATG